MFVFVTKAEIRRRRAEAKKIVRILDNLGWVDPANSRVKRHKRSEWAKKSLSAGEVLPVGDMGAPRWYTERVANLPSDATLHFNFFALDLSTETSAITPYLGPAPVSRDPASLLSDMEKFTAREFGVKFSRLVRHYIKEKFDGVQAGAARAAMVDPQLVNQIYNAELKPRGKRTRGVEKKTVIALGLAFKLTIEEAKEFLQSAGYAFSDSFEDQFFEQCFKERLHNISKINEALRIMQLPEIGSPGCRVCESIK